MARSCPSSAASAPPADISGRAEDGPARRSPSATRSPRRSGWASMTTARRIPATTASGSSRWQPRRGQRLTADAPRLGRQGRGVVSRPDRELRLGLQAELGEQVGHVPLDRPLRDHQRLGDLAVGQPAADEGRDFSFTQCQGARSVGRGPGHGTSRSGIRDPGRPSASAYSAACCGPMAPPAHSSAQVARPNAARAGSRRRANLGRSLGRSGIPIVSRSASAAGAAASRPSSPTRPSSRPRRPREPRPTPHDGRAQLASGTIRHRVSDFAPELDGTAGVADGESR